MEAITREEKLMSAASSGKSSGIKPITREEMFLSYIAGESKDKPKPITRKEMFLDKIEKGEGGGTSGGGDIVALLEGTIEEITIPNEVTKLRNGAFVGFDVLKEINADESHEVYASADGILYTKDGKKLVSYPPAKEEIEYIMPDSVEEVESMAFNGTTRLERVVVGENLKTFPKNMAIENEEVEIALIANADILSQGGVYPVESKVINSFVIPKETAYVSVTAIDTLPNIENIYYNGGELEVVGYDNGKGTMLYQNLFTNTYKLKKLVVNIKDIPDNFMPNSSSATTLIIGDDVETIGDNAFTSQYSNANLIIGNNVKSIGYGAFQNSSIRGTVIIPDSVTELVEGTSLDMNGCRTFYRTTITGVVIGKGLTRLGTHMFSETFLEEVTIPSNIKVIGGAFIQCYQLTKVEIEEGVETIESSAFSMCFNLADVYIPRSVTSIDSSAFISAGTNVEGGLTIHGYAGSYAETFATENGFNFEVIEE